MTEHATKTFLPLRPPRRQSTVLGPHQRPDTDVVYSIKLKEKGQEDRVFFKDTPWKGINNGLPGSDPDEDEEKIAVLNLNVDADVKDKTKKMPNTLRSWKDEEADFEFGRDAILVEVCRLKTYAKEVERTMYHSVEHR